MRGKTIKTDGCKLLLDALKLIGISGSDGVNNRCVGIAIYAKESGFLFCSKHFVFYIA
jgi:hypothetical protein